MAVAAQPGIEFREEEWEHGLACLDCLRVLREGDRYSERLLALAAGAPVVELVCLECRMTAS